MGKEIRHAAVLYNEEGGPSQALLDILQYFSVPHEGSWESIVLATQKAWLRPLGKERWHCLPQKTKEAKEVYPLFSRLQLTSSYHAVQPHYDYILIPGATVQVVKQRIRFLVEEWNRGVRFKNIVLLTGDRLLDPHFENMRTLGSPSEELTPGNETQMMVLLTQQMFPPSWHSIPLIVVDTPAPTGRKRPNTQETFACWLERNPKPGKALIVSSQPFIGRQDTIARQMLPPAFGVETVGPGASLQQYLSEPRAERIVLDEIARWIYQENKS